MRLRFLGTGTSFGVPQIACRCAVCGSPDPRDKRTRCGALIEVSTAAGAMVRLLLDTPPELRLQLVSAQVDHLDAVLFTHDHADHVHGIDDLRPFTMRRGEPLTLYGAADTLATLRTRFPYITDQAFQPVAGTTRPEGRLVAVEPGVPFVAAGVSIMPVAVPHGRTTVLGFRIGDLAYVTDAKAIPDATFEALRGVRVLVLNALLRDPHPTHLSISEAVAVAQRIGADRTYLTHLTHHHAHAELEAELPDGIRPAYDGLMVDLP